MDQSAEENENAQPNAAAALVAAGHRHHGPPARRPRPGRVVRVVRHAQPVVHGCGGRRAGPGAKRRKRKKEKTRACCAWPRANGPSFLSSHSFPQQNRTLKHSPSSARGTRAATRATRTAGKVARRPPASRRRRPRRRPARSMRWPCARAPSRSTAPVPPPPACRPCRPPPPPPSRRRRPPRRRPPHPSAARRRACPRSARRGSATRTRWRRS